MHAENLVKKNGGQAGGKRLIAAPFLIGAKTKKGDCCKSEYAVKPISGELVRA